VNPSDVDELDWSKGDDLLPAVVQHADTGQVLMVGFMDPPALRATLERRRVTFFSRRRQQQWTKGETSGNFIDVVDVGADCDRDTVLVRGRPAGPVCHTGEATCFHGLRPLPAAEFGFLAQLEQVIDQRLASGSATSYTARLVAAGPNRVAQKVGEEGLEVALAAVGDGSALIAESADLLFHLLVLLRSRGQSLGAVVHELERRGAQPGLRSGAAR